MNRPNYVIRRYAIVARLRPAYLSAGEVFLPDPGFPKYWFKVRLPLDVPFDPNSTHGDPSDIGSEDYNDQKGSRNAPTWRNWRNLPTENKCKVKGGPTIQRKGKNNGRVKGIWWYRMFKRRRKIRVAPGKYMKEENGALPIQFHHDGEHDLEEVIFDALVTDPLGIHALSAAHVLAICFSVTDLSALEKIPHHWIPLLRHRCPILPIVLIACDIEKRMEHSDNTRVTYHRRTGTHGIKHITRSQGEKVAKEIGAKYYIECSRKTGENVELAYQAMAAALIYKEGGRTTGAIKNDIHTEIALSQSDWKMDLLSKRGKDGRSILSKLYSIFGYTK